MKQSVLVNLKRTVIDTFGRHEPLKNIRLLDGVAGRVEVLISQKAVNRFEIGPKITGTPDEVVGIIRTAVESRQVEFAPQMMELVGA